MFKGILYPRCAVSSVIVRHWMCFELLYQVCDNLQDSSNRIKLVLVSFTASHLEYRWTSIYWYFARSSLLGNTSNYNTIFICWLGRFITTCLYPKRHISLIKDRFSGLNEITDIWKSIILGCATYKKISAVPRCSFRYLIKAMCNLSCFSIQLV